MCPELPASPISVLLQLAECLVSQGGPQYDCSYLMSVSRHVYNTILQLCMLIVPPEASHPETTNVSFLVSVNLTWGNCIKTVRTPPLKPNQQWNKTTPITVGNCDHGPLTYTINESTTERMSSCFSSVWVVQNVY